MALALPPAPAPEIAATEEEHQNQDDDQKCCRVHVRSLCSKLVCFSLRPASTKAPPVRKGVDERSGFLGGKTTLLQVFRQKWL
jgi:hypothetical protein